MHGSKPDRVSKLQAERLARFIRDAYAPLRDDYARLKRGSALAWREAFVIAVASAAAGAIFGMVISVLWGWGSSLWGSVASALSGR